MKKQWISLSLVATLGLFTMASCGSNETAQQGEVVEETVIEEVTVNEEVREITIEGNDAMQFNTNQLHADAGQKVRLTLKHTGEMAIEVMGHNFVLLAADTDVEEFARAAQDAKETDYIPASFEGQIIAHTEMIGGGQETTIEFTAPEAGNYNFLCSFPGHSGSMKGIMIVK